MPDHDLELSTLSNHLWESANILRGPVDAAGEREVQKALRKTLLKYHLHKDQDLFDRAYGYIRQYY